MVNGKEMVYPFLGWALGMVIGVMLDNIPVGIVLAISFSSAVTNCVNARRQQAQQRYGDQLADRR